MNKNLEVALKRIEDAKALNSTHLDLSYMFLSRLPDELFGLTRLISLDVSGNYLFDIPEEINNLTQLRELNISDNYLESRALENIHHIGEIKYFQYERNPFLNGIPPEIVRRGIAYILNYHRYFKGQQKDARLNEAKVLFVGNGEVGKTTIMKKLISPRYKVKVGLEPSTHGITIREWHVTQKMKVGISHDLGWDKPLRTKERKIRLNLWDFGGQEIYHATHQFFLTKRSIYILVWEARKEEDYAMFDYWLNIIKFLSANCFVIVVMNKAEIREKRLDEQLLKRKFTNIFSFLNVSCVTNEGLAGLARDIKNVLKVLPHIDDRMPSPWKLIRKRIGDLGKNYISIEEYYRICAVYFIDIPQADFLADYLNDLGSILYFSKDTLLSNTLIINPEWVTKAVYNLIDSRLIQRKQGRFSMQDLPTILDRTVYPKNRHMDIVRLMEKFELCFNLVGTNDYIIPELLSSDGMAFRGVDFQNNTLQLECRYQFMPSGIIGRLICRLHHLIPEDLFWKQGMILRYEMSYALIRAESINNKLIIKITDVDAAQVLSIIRNELGVIHDSLNLKKEVDYFEMIPCICGECINSITPEYYRHTTLRKFFLKEKTTITCERSVEEIDINALLNGYDVKARKNDLLYIILSACARLQGHKKIVSGDEDSRNTFIAGLIDSDKYISKDQTRWGKSARGIREGELDIKVEDEKRLPLSIFEAFQLKTFKESVISLHLEKMFGYDPNGLKENYIVIYSEARDFAAQWRKYLLYIEGISYKFELIAKPADISARYAYGTEIKIGITLHKRNGESVKLYHIMVNMAEQ